MPGEGSESVGGIGSFAEAKVSQRAMYKAPSPTINIVEDIWGGTPDTKVIRTAARCIARGDDTKQWGWRRPESAWGQSGRPWHAMKETRTGKGRTTRSRAGREARMDAAL